MISPFFSANEITAGYGFHTVIKNISFTLKPGTMTGLLGTNGSGKSTLLKTLCCQLPHTGSLILQDKRLERLSSRQLAQQISYIPQKGGLAFSLPVLDVVLMGFNPVLKLLQSPSRAQKQTAFLALEQVGLSGMEQQDFQTLSEGQKQLVILARTLVADTRLLLLDEPDSALDFCNRYRMCRLLREIVTEQQKACLFCLHDPCLALEFCDKLLVIKDGTVLAMLCPAQDSIEKMQAVLREIYGPVSLTHCLDSEGKKRLVLLA